MKFAEKESIFKLTDKLENYSQLTEKESFETYREILEPILKVDGYRVLKENTRFKPYAFTAIKENDRIGIFIDSGRLNLSDYWLNDYLLRSRMMNLSRNIILLTSQFPKQRTARIFEAYPVTIEIVDFPKIREWINQIDTASDENENLEIIFKKLNQQLIKHLHKNPTELNHIEWRDLERISAELFDGLGFEVELTRPSKDGGKDLILNYKDSKGEYSYIVELKHWRENRVGGEIPIEFLHVIIRENRMKGLLISTNGFTKNAFEGLTKIDRNRIKFAEKDKIFSLCEIYIKKRAGLWIPDNSIETTLFGDTI